jgi:hypothetical protein
MPHQALTHPYQTCCEQDADNLDHLPGGERQRAEAEMDAAAGPGSDMN